MKKKESFVATVPTAGNALHGFRNVAVSFQHVLYKSVVSDRKPKLATNAFTLFGLIVKQQSERSDYTGGNGTLAPAASLARAS